MTIQSNLCKSAAIALIFLMIAACLIGCSGTDKAASPAEPVRPNILWIIAEDMGPDIGFYNVPEARTPNMDALAAKGMVFDKAFTTAPICSISRSALFTGMHATTIGAHQHRTDKADKKPLPDGVKLMTHRLNDAGYYTSMVENIFPDGHDLNWIKGANKLDWNFLFDKKTAYNGKDFADLKTKEPFFAQVQFKETHRGGYWDAAHEIIPTPADPAKIKLPPYYPDHPVARADWAQYLNAVMAFDLKVDAVLGRLEDEGLADNTIVFVYADHGRAMPRGKQWLYDPGLQIPLIVYVPPALGSLNGYSAKSRTDRLISGIDLPATTLSLAGATMGPVMQGRVFLGAQNSPPRDYVFGARDRAGEADDRIRSVRDQRFLYIKNFYPERPYSQQSLYKELQYPITRLMFRLHRDGNLGPVPSLFMADNRPTEELYDTVSDTHNIQNLAEDPEYAGQLNRLRGVLETWITDSDDQGRFREAPAYIEGLRRASDKKNQRKIKAMIKAEGHWRAPDYWTLEQGQASKP